MVGEPTALMRLYALRGVNQWTQPANYNLRQTAKRSILDGIVENEAGVGQVVSKGAPKFLPMMELPGRKRAGYEWCFFLPLSQGGQLVSLVLLWLAQQGGSSAGQTALAFRFERDRETESRHRYWHMQLTRKIKVPGGKDIDVKRLPGWLPDSYPAFPVPGESCLDMFLAMLTAVHGYPNGVEDVIKGLWQRASQPQEARFYLKRLKAMGVATD